MMINCATSVTVVTVRLYRNRMGFSRVHAFETFDHLDRNFIGQYCTLLTKAQDVTWDLPSQHLSQSSIINYKNNAVAIV